MTKHGIAVSAALIFGSAALVGCDGSSTRVSQDGDGDVKQLLVRASKGALVGATCTIAPVNNPDNQIGTCTTNADGDCNLNIPAQTGPVLVSCTGGSYYDEATDTTVQLGNNVARSIAPSTRSSVAVTPLTDLAASRALAAVEGGQQVTDETIEQTKRDVSSFFGVDDILDPPQPIRNAADKANLSGDEAGAYAAALAGFSQLALDKGVDPFTLTQNLNSDLADDGVINSQVTQSEIDTATSNAAQGTPAAAEVQENQSQPDRNTGSISNPGTGGTSG